MRATQRKAVRTARPVRRKRRSPAEVRTRLLDAAREEFKLSGYAGATTAAISKRADVAEIQMFRYFPSKAELFREAIVAPLTDHFRAFHEQYGPEAVDAATKRERALLYAAELQSFLNEHVKLLVSLFVAQTYGAPSLDGSGTGLDELQTFFDEGSALMASRASGTSPFDPGTMFRVAFGALLGCVTYKDWLFPSPQRDNAEIEAAIAEFILFGIGPHSDISPAAG